MSRKNIPPSGRRHRIIFDDPLRLHVEKKHPAVWKTAGFLFSRPYASELATAFENKNIRQNWRMFFHL